MENCKFEEQWENKYTKFHEVSEIATQDENYHFNLEFYAYGGRDVHVLLSTIPKPDDGNGTAYEISKKKHIALDSYEARSYLLKMFLISSYWRMGQYSATYS